MNIAQKERERKEAHPEDFCGDRRCLWRTQTRDGYKPCPKHPVSKRSPEPLPEAYINPNSPSAEMREEYEPVLGSDDR